jgi:hypothetical protein
VRYNYGRVISISVYIAIIFYLEECFRFPLEASGRFALFVLLAESREMSFSLAIEAGNLRHFHLIYFLLRVVLDCCRFRDYWKFQDWFPFSMFSRVAGELFRLALLSSSRGLFSRLSINLFHIFFPLIAVFEIQR